MAGFTILIHKNNSRQSFYEKEKKDFFQAKKIETSEYIIKHSSHFNFNCDSFLQEDESYIIGIEGVILNLAELEQETSKTSLFDVLKYLFTKQNTDFINLLKGDFSGYIYSKTSREWYIFTNQTGSKRVFYYQNNNFIVLSSELKDISKLINSQSLKVELDINGAYSLLTYGYMLHDLTLVKDVKRLLPGQIIAYKNGMTNIKEYFHLRNIAQTKENKELIIEKMDKLFNDAIILEYEKDKEYVKKHIATLSGGLDSRMTVLVGHKLGYTEQTNFTFSQSKYLDETIANDIAIKCRHDFIFQALDNGNYLKNIDETVEYNDGLVTYSGSAHLLHVMKNLNFNQYGLVHTGMLGDAIIGTYLSYPYKTLPSINSGAFSVKLIDRIKPYVEEIIKNYSNEELFKIYNRGFLGILNGYIYIDQFTQAVSPFLDKDFLSYCYSIPEKYKYKQRIYIEWINKKHPDFNNFPWEKTGVSPSLSFSYLRYLSPKFYMRMSKKFFDKINGKLKSGMNPFDYWISDNKELRDYLNTYFNDNINLVRNNKELEKDCHSLFEEGNSGEKFQVLTLLSAIKLHKINI